MVLVMRLRHGRLLTKAMPGAVFMHGEDEGEHRQWVLDEFRAKRLPVVVTTLGNEGLDIPTLDRVVIAAGGESSLLSFQRMRGMTPAPGKTHCTVLDFDDRTRYMNRHSLARLTAYRSEAAFQVEELEVNDVAAMGRGTSS